ncbi:anti-sigma factor [Salinibacterium sp. SYSU T00001]|uniref:anti-sigma factor n=1 Tax=Homoserinimonas sedimenticola TaxID=2986805 RepID=UPI0022368262|nr:anti-sigma factor [Salinibacterium sedimenticola]MCW4386107.1 anti-sigma factor [Salinibacterium sedimenticola]
MSERRSPEELAAAYALGALSPEERAEYETWRAQQADASANPDSFDDVAAALGLAAEPVQPSEDLRSRLLAQVAVTPQLPAEPDAPAAVVESPAPVEPVETKPAAPAKPVESPAPVKPVETKPATPTPGPAERRARSRWTRPATLLTAAAAAVLLFVGGGVAGSLIAQNSFRVEQATALAELQTASDAQQAVAPVAGGGTATLVWSAEQQRSAILIDELPELPEGSTYQLWYINAEGAIPDATFEASEDGKTWRVLEGTMSAGDAVGVTVEPEGGSEEPTSEPIVVLASA